MIFQFLGKCKAFIRNLFSVPTEEVWEKIEDVLLQCDRINDIEPEVVNILPVEEKVVEQPILLLESPKIEIQPQVDEVLDVFPEVVEEIKEEIVELPIEEVNEEVEQLELSFEGEKEEIAEDVKQESFDIPKIITDQISILPQIIESVQQFIESRVEEPVQELNIPEIQDSSIKEIETEDKIGNISEDTIQEPTQSICQRIRRVRKKILRYRSAELVAIPREIQQRQVQMKSGGVTIITYPGVRNHRNGCNPINFRTINMNGVTPKAL